MVSEEDLQEFMDCRMSAEDAGRVLSRLKDDGSLGEFLFAESAAAMLDDSALCADFLSADEIAEYDDLRSRALESQPSAALRKIGYTTDEEDSSSVAAEPETPYGAL